MSEVDQFWNTECYIMNGFQNYSVQIATPNLQKN